MNQERIVKEYRTGNIMIEVFKSNNGDYFVADAINENIDYGMGNTVPEAENDLFTRLKDYYQEKITHLTIEKDKGIFPDLVERRIARIRKNLEVVTQKLSESQIPQLNVGGNK